MSFDLSSIPTQIICALITLVGVIYANLSSRRIAKRTTEKELEKLERTWKHDDAVAYEQAFRDMIEAVTKYILDSSGTKQEIAQTKVVLMLSYATGELAAKVDNLYNSLKRNSPIDAESQLKDAIECRRDIRTQQEKSQKKFLFF